MRFSSDRPMRDWRSSLQLMIPESALRLHIAGTDNFQNSIASLKITDHHLVVYQ